MFSVEIIVHGYHEYQNTWDAHEILSCEREVGNIHDTFAVAITKDNKGSHHCRLSLFQQLSFQFQTFELVINLHIDPYYVCHQTKALNLVVCLHTCWQRKSPTMGFSVELISLLGLGRGCLRVVFN